MVVDLFALVGYALLAVGLVVCAPTPNGFLPSVLRAFVWLWGATAWTPMTLLVEFGDQHRVARFYPRSASRRSSRRT